MTCPNCKHDAFSHNAEQCTHKLPRSAYAVRNVCNCEFSRGDVIDRHNVEEALKGALSHAGVDASTA